MSKKRIWSIAALVIVSACSRDEVARYRVPKSDPGAATPAPPPPPDASAVGTLQWTLPKGWTEERSQGGMRYATIRPTPTGKGKVEVSVTVFPGPAGGELANVNRWRNQIGLPPVDEGALAKDRKSLGSPAGKLALFDYASDEKDPTRMVAAILFDGGNSWFVKMVGPREAVTATRADFIHLLESLRLARP
ncbi:MAG: hypothetical protein WCK73_08570 [Deltaproteobacteria bacterium]